MTKILLALLAIAHAQFASPGFWARTTKKITYVQLAAASSSTLPTVTANFGSTVAAGTLVVCAAQTFTGSTASISLSDSRANTWTLLRSETYQGATAALFYTVVTNPGSMQVTASYSNALSWYQIDCYNFSGNATTAPVDAWAPQTGTNSVALLNLPTTQSATMLFGYAYTGATPTQGSGFTRLPATDGNLAEYRTVDVINNSHRVNFTQNATDDYIFFAVAFKAK